MKATADCRRRLAGAAALLLGLAGATATDTPALAADDANTPAALLAMMSGDFDNRAQFTAQPAAEKPLFSLLGVQRRAVTVPALGAHMLYAQVNNDADPGKVYRQRLYSFTAAGGGEVVMESWSFVDEAAVRDVLGRLADLATMPAAAFRPSLPDGCEMRWIRDDDSWTGRVDPATCTIASKRSGAPMKLRATEIVTADRLWNEESGFTPDGAMVFGLPDGVYYEFLPAAVR